MPNLIICGNCPTKTNLGNAITTNILRKQPLSLTANPNRAVLCLFFFKKRLYRIHLTKTGVKVGTLGINPNILRVKTNAPNIADTMREVTANVVEVADNLREVVPNVSDFTDTVSKLVPTSAEVKQGVRHVKNAVFDVRAALFEVTGTLFDLAAVVSDVRAIVVDVAHTLSDAIAIVFDPVNFDFDVGLRKVEERNCLMDAIMRKREIDQNLIDVRNEAIDNKKRDTLLDIPFFNVLIALCFLISTASNFYFITQDFCISDKCRGNFWDLQVFGMGIVGIALQLVFLIL